MEITFSLPYCLLLPNGDYQVRISEGDIVTLRLVQKIPDSYDERLGMRGLLKSDLEGYEKAGVMNVENDCPGPRAKDISVEEILEMKDALLIEYFRKDGKNFAPPTEIVMNQEIPHDPFGRFRYTKVTFISDNREDVMQRAAAAINKLVVSFRVNTDSFWITPIREKDLEVYEAAGEKRFYGMIKFAPFADEEKVGQIRKDLMNDPGEMPFHMLYLDAQNAYEQMNYTLSIIYSITSIESLVKTFLRMYSTRHKIQGVSKKGLLRSPIHNAVSVILRLIISKAELSDQMILDFIEANKIRNSVIHQARQDVSEPDAQKAIRTLEAFMAVLLPKIRDLLREHLKEFHENKHKAV